MSYDPDLFDHELKQKLESMHPAARGPFLRQIVYDQIISSIPVDAAVLQGGAGVRSQLKFGAQTKDVDMLIREGVATKVGLLSMDDEDRNRYLVGYARNMFDARKPDYCQLRVIRAQNFNNVRTNELASQLILEAEVGSQKLPDQIALDFGIQTHPIMVREIPSNNLLKFVGLENPNINVLSPEDLAAIKLCVFMEHLNEPERFRPQDIAHSAALAANYSFDKEAFARALAFNAFERGIVDKLAKPLPKPIFPYARSVGQYQDLAKQCKLSPDINDAMKILNKPYNSVHEKAYSIGMELVRGNHESLRLPDISDSRAVDGQP